MKKTSLIIAMFALLVGTGVLAKVDDNPSANEDNPNRTGARQQIKEDRKQLNEDRKEMRTEAKEQRQERKCEVTTARIQERVTRYDNNKTLGIKAYQNMKARITKLVTNLESKGYEVTVLESDLTELDVKLKKLSDDYAAFIAKLKDSQSYACGQSEGEFASRVKASRELRSTVREDQKEVRDFFRTVIHPHFKEVVAQKATTEETAKEDADETETDSQVVE